MRSVLNREIVCRLRVDDEGGRLCDADATPTIIVKDGAGATISGTVITVEDLGVYVATIPARTQHDKISAVWSFSVAGFARSVTTNIVLITERLVPLWQLREDEILADLSSATLQRISDTVEEWLGNALKFPVVAEAWRGTWREEFETSRLRVPGVAYPQNLYALSSGWGSTQTAMTAPELAEIRVQINGFEHGSSVNGFISGHAASPLAFPSGLWTAWISHGLVDPGDDLRRGATILARYTARISNLPERTRRILTADTEIDLSMPSPDRPTGLPDVDAVIGRYRLQAL